MNRKPSNAMLSAQQESAGISSTAIVDAVLGESRLASGMTWLDIGCGAGDLLRRVLDEARPSRAIGVDIIDFVPDDLRDRVDVRIGPALEVLEDLPVADRVVMSEVIEHLEAPWLTLRAAARLVAPGGRIVVSTPHVGTLRSRLSLLVRGDLTSFRADNAPHLGPALPHVMAQILADEELIVDPARYAQVDVAPLSGGRPWPGALARRRPDLACISVVVAASRPG